MRTIGSDREPVLKASISTGLVTTTWAKKTISSGTEELLNHSLIGMEVSPTTGYGEKTVLKLTLTESGTIRVVVTADLIFVRRKTPLNTLTLLTTSNSSSTIP